MYGNEFVLLNNFDLLRDPQNRPKGLNADLYKKNYRSVQFSIFLRFSFNCEVIPRNIILNKLKHVMSF